MRFFPISLSIQTIIIICSAISLLSVSSSICVFVCIGGKNAARQIIWSKCYYCNVITKLKRRLPWNRFKCEWFDFPFPFSYYCSTSYFSCLMLKCSMQLARAAGIQLAINKKHDKSNKNIMELFKPQSKWIWIGLQSH